MDVRERNNYHRKGGGEGGFRRLEETFVVRFTIRQGSSVAVVLVDDIFCLFSLSIDRNSREISICFIKL